MGALEGATSRGVYIVRASQGTFSSFSYLDLYYTMCTNCVPAINVLNKKKKKKKKKKRKKLNIFRVFLTTLKHGHVFVMGSKATCMASLCFRLMLYH